MTKNKTENQWVHWCYNFDRTPPLRWDMTFPMPDGCTLCLGARVFAFAGCCWENRKQSTKELVWQVSTSERFWKSWASKAVCWSCWGSLWISKTQPCTMRWPLWSHHVHSFPDCRISVAAVPERSWKCGGSSALAASDFHLTCRLANRHGGLRLLMACMTTQQAGCTQCLRFCCLN